MKEKPTCTLVGTDGNVYALASRVGIALRESGQPDQADDMWTRLWQCQSYDEALRLFAEYVEIR